CRYEAPNGAIGYDPAELLREEEESLVFLGVVHLRNKYRTANGVPEVVIPKWITGFLRVRLLVQHAVRVQDVIAEEFVSVPVETARSRFRCYIDNATGAPAKFGCVLSAQSLEFGDCVYAREIKECLVRSAINVVGTVDCPVVPAVSLTVD